MRIGWLVINLCKSLSVVLLLPRVSTKIAGPGEKTAFYAGSPPFSVRKRTQGGDILAIHARATRHKSNRPVFSHLPFRLNATMYATVQTPPGSVPSLEFGRLSDR
jgi:hypothetical protein